MDIEYHYYITAIIAQRAGFPDGEAFRIGYSSQYTDDNNRQYTVYGGEGGAYENYISQTLDITKPKEELIRIHPVFHFFPGTLNEIARNALPRKDGKLHLLNTIPNNANSRKLMQWALKSRNPYRVGLATHTYADTFAHQNFVGVKDDFNSMKGLLEALIPNIGHADAKHDPDWPALVWDDDRIHSKHRRIDNKSRFLEASEHIFTLYRLHLDPELSEVKLKRDRRNLVAELDAAIGAKDRSNARKDTRIKRYQKLLGSAIGEYKKRQWFSKAFKRTNIDPLRGGGTYQWRGSDYRESDWYRFQEALKANQEKAKEILAPVFAKTELVSASIW
jgi:hypothetical protein